MSVEICSRKKTEIAYELLYSRVNKLIHRNMNTSEFINYYALTYKIRNMSCKEVESYIDMVFKKLLSECKEYMKYGRYCV